ncbi:MAG: hypothetical protein ACRD0P_30365 [Stackebrandtia sp.]
MSVDKTTPDLKQRHNFDVFHKREFFGISTRSMEQEFTIDGRKFDSVERLAEEIATAKEALTAAGIEYAAYSVPVADDYTPRLPDWPTWRDANLTH